MRGKLSTHTCTVLFVASLVSLAGSFDDVKAQAPQVSPKAAEEYAADSEKAASGDPEAAYRIGEALESGRLSGLKDLDKALTFYRLAAQKGHQDAAARMAELEAELGQNQKGSPPPSSPGN
jgi:TPR repeat protein